ncbi:ECF transporter S component [Aminipila luticellarii]|uniref:ECF transporter S component n=1 Tax=Aminipila luticellarii TaxID=2507160 RepID=A0A410PYM2_9FIRM|nr:ECF transporter S component [Aminipila luticellarii]QAT43975.1 ECF transporter S component [Aminipila luticellarii]
MSTHTQSVSDSRNATKTLVINALFIALTLAATMFINIRLPIPGNGGLIHLGNVPLFIAAIVYGKKTGALAGAFGMGMFDLISGWTAWAPFTFVIVGLMGFTVGLITEKLHFKPAVVNTIAIAAALIIKLVGYYFAEVFLYGNWIQPFGSVPGNIMQIVVAAVIVLPIVERLKKIAK